MMETATSKLSERFFSDAISLMGMFPSDHPLATERTSSSEAEIMALAFLLNCEKQEAVRLMPFFRQTLLVAESMGLTK